MSTARNSPHIRFRYMFAMIINLLFINALLGEVLHFQLNFGETTLIFNPKIYFILLPLIPLRAGQAICQSLPGARTR